MPSPAASTPAPRPPSRPATKAPTRKGICAHRFSYDTRSCNYQFYEGANIAFRSATCYVGDDCTNINNYNFISDWMTRRNDN